jgi:hypothetical protein
VCSWSLLYVPTQLEATLSTALSTLLASLLSTHAALAEPSTIQRDVGSLAMPIGSFDTDDGLGFGGRAEINWREAGVEPYRAALMAQGFATFRGYQNHELRWDQLELGPRGRDRLMVYGAWRQWLNDGYWGIGNGTTRELASTAEYEADDPRRKRYRYTLKQPFLHATVQHELGEASAWSVYGAVNPKYSAIETYEGSLLAQQRPYGMAGGFAIQLMAGVIHDTRAPEIAPRSGHVLELGGRLSPALQGEAGGFAGPLLSARGYRPIGDRMVLAGRVMGEWLFGQVPFYEMVHWAGLRPIEGVGGSRTVRGLSFGRVRGPGKAVANAELRIRAASWTLFQRSFDVELAPFTDAAAVWDAGDDATAPSPALPLHPAAGFGLGAIFDRSFVGRIDLGWALDPVQQDDGSVVQEPTFGLYMAFDHVF